MARSGAAIPMQRGKPVGRTSAPAQNRRARPLRKTATGLWIGLMVLFFVEALFYAWCRVQCVNVGYDISEALDYNDKLLKLQKNLRIELARLKSPERITKIAKDKLGLVLPKPDQTIVIP